MSDKKMKACSRCGSLRIRPFSLSEGGVPGASELAGMYYCERCRRRVMPIVFDDEKEYRKFVKTKQSSE